MQGYHSIESVAEHLVEGYNWTDSFLRECYLVSEGYMWDKIDAGGLLYTGTTGGKRIARLVVACADNSVNIGIEFLLVGVELMSFRDSHDDESMFEWKIDNHARHCVRFVGVYCTAWSILVRFLGHDYQGPELLAGHEMPSPDAIEAKKVEDYWRQCSACCNIWEESPRLVYCRCPDCKALTRLVS